MFFKIGIENHGDVADENPPQQGGAEHAAIEVDEAVGNKGGEPRDFRRERLVENDAELALNFTGVQNAVAQNAANDRAAEQIVIAQAIAAHGGDAAALDTFAPEIARLAPFISDGLVDLEGGVLRTSLLGRIFIRNIAMVFDPYLEKQKLESRPLFSKTL